MKEENIIMNKAKKFAVRTINLYKYMRDEKHEFVLSKQVLRSGTSIISPPLWATTLPTGP